MRLGNNQYFQDYVKEYEYRVALCGEQETYTSQGKSLHLRLTLYDRLKKALIDMHLPSPKDYRAYVNAIRKVASDLERYEDYRPRGGPNTGPQARQYGKLGSGMKEKELDEEGDFKIDGVNAIKARLRAKNETENKIKASKPRTSWRTEKEYNRLLKEGRRVRCASNGHKAPKCQKYRRAKRTEGDVGALDADLSESSSLDSGKDEP